MHGTLEHYAQDAPTAPFTPRRDRWKALFASAGPGLLVAAGYMDPGNWATDIEAGSRSGYDLLFVVLLCGLAAMLLQTLALRLGITSGHDLARMAREHYRPTICRALWVLAEIAIIATDLAEVLGSALAFKLLLSVPLWIGVLMTGLDTMLVLAFQNRAMRRIEAIMLGLILTIGLCFAAQLVIAPPSLSGILHGSVPRTAALTQPHALYLAVGILGATVMPHNLYLHSAIARKRPAARGDQNIRLALRFATIDIVVSLLIATVINGAILALAASAFHAHGYREVADIADAWRLLAPLTGGTIAATLFAIALLAAGQSATFTGTMAGQVVLEGFLDLKIPDWQRRLITRLLAIAPALVCILSMGDGSIGSLLVLSQVVLSISLPFAIWPLIRFTGDSNIMGAFANGRCVAVLAHALCGMIVAANLWLIIGWLN